MESRIKNSFPKDKREPKQKDKKIISAMHVCNDVTELSPAIRKQSKSEEFVQSYHPEITYSGCAQCCFDNFQMFQMIDERNETEELRNITLFEIHNHLIEESHAEARHLKLEDRWKRSSNTIQALNFYISCYILEQKSLNRFYEQLNKMICNEESLKVTPELFRLLQEQYHSVGDLSHLQQIINEKIFPSEVKNLCSTFKTCKDNFELASKNFILLLHNSHLSASQLEKLRQQYQDILIQYQHARIILDQTIPDLITKLLNCLVDTFQTLNKFVIPRRKSQTQMTQIFITVMGNHSQHTSKKLVIRKSRARERLENEKAYLSC